MNKVVYLNSHTMSEIEKHEEIKNLKNQKEKIEKKLKELLK